MNIWLLRSCFRRLMRDRAHGSMTLPWNRRITSPNQKIEIGAAVSLHDVVVVELGIASLGRSLRWFPCFSSSFNFGLGNVEIKRAGRNVKIDHVAVRDDAQRASGRGFGGDVQDYGAI